MIGGEAQVAPVDEVGPLTLFSKRVEKVKSNSGVLAEPTVPDAARPIVWFGISMQTPVLDKPASGP